MKIKTSLAITQIVLLTGFTVVLLYFGNAFWLEDYIAREQGENRERIARIAAAFDQNCNILLTLTNDWGFWDDAYAFVNGVKPEFAEQYGQTNALSLSKMGVDLMLLYDKDGNKLLTSFADSSRERSLVDDGKLSSVFAKDGVLQQLQLEKSNTGGAFTTVVMCGKNPILVAATKVMPNNGKGEFSGHVLFGKEINDKFLADLLKKNYIHDVKLEFSDDPPQWLRTKISNSVQLFKYYPDPQSENESGFFVVRTLGKQPLYVKTTVMVEGKAKGKMEMFVLILLTCVLTVVLLHFIIARRVLFGKFNIIADFLQRFDVNQLRFNVKRLELSGEDELNDMAKAFNQTINEVGVLYKNLLTELEEHKKIEQQLNEAQIGTIYSLAKLAECRDNDTGIHLARISRTCKLIAGMARLRPEYSALIDDKFISAIEVAATLHDIGKVGVSDAILNKSADLTAEEFEMIKKHTVLGANALQEMSEKYPANEFLKMACEIARCHHERWSGKGYPRGIGGVEIPLSARITAIADVFDALISSRCYKPAYNSETSKNIIADLSGEQFDPILVEVFIECYADIIKQYYPIYEADV
ncbi:MAG: HD domain-containing phosphohydrolase [Negativicutes bacterium]|jgi:response regulator RpfG family c-di-GMP phosphodiesterase/sensor domain CHASE-containing protein